LPSAPTSVPDWLPRGVTDLAEDDGDMNAAALENEFLSRELFDCGDDIPLLEDSFASAAAEAPVEGSPPPPRADTGPRPSDAETLAAAKKLLSGFGLALGARQKVCLAALSASFVRATHSVATHTHTHTHTHTQLKHPPPLPPPPSPLLLSPSRRRSKRR
jgi:hypothetical protein